MDQRTGRQKPWYLLPCNEEGVDPNENLGLVVKLEACWVNTPWLCTNSHSFMGQPVQSVDECKGYRLFDLRPGMDHDEINRRPAHVLIYLDSESRPFIRLVEPDPPPLVKVTGVLTICAMVKADQMVRFDRGIYSFLSGDSLPGYRQAICLTDADHRAAYVDDGSWTTYHRLVMVSDCIMGHDDIYDVNRTKERIDRFVETGEVPDGSYVIRRRAE